MIDFLSTKIKKLHSAIFKLQIYYKYHWKYFFFKFLLLEYKNFYLTLLALDFFQTHFCQYFDKCFLSLFLNLQ